MLTIFDGRAAQFCDGISRRGFLRAGFLGAGALSLSDVLRLRAQATESGSTARHTAVIFLELAGGPSQFETYDPKPNAPREYRGPFSAIDTAQPGVQFCELLPEQAALVDKLTVIRSIRHDKNSHDPSSHLAQTGYYKAGTKGGPNEMPCFGSVITRLRGPNAPAIPAYVAVPNMMRNGGAAHLGKNCEPFEIEGDPNASKFRIKNLTTVESLDFARLGDRYALRSALDAQHQLLDLGGSAAALDKFTQQAFELVSGPRARDAFDIDRESDVCREQYGRNTVGQSLLLARRLVEAGVTCVTVRVTGWDDHVDLPKRILTRAANYDRGIAALINDLSARGLSDDVLVVAMGEFGRTPRVNRTAGRDHWGALMSVLLAGGGLRPGVYGTSNSKGEVPVEMPYRPENVLAMLYRHLGIDPDTTFDDFSGRPRYVLEERALIREIV